MGVNEGGVKKADRPVELDDRSDVGLKPVASAVDTNSPGSPPSVKEAPPLDELMLAMDVVDTLRHRELMLDREIEADDRDQDLLKRLREIYTSQGIKVTDDVLEQGVRALREERFVYSGPEPGVGRSLAMAYVTRARWGRWVGGTVTLLAIAALAFQFLIRGPELAAIAALPTDIEGAYQGVVVSTQDPAILSEALAIHDNGEVAVEQHDYTAAQGAVTSLRSLGDRLQQAYELRVVQRRGERSGVWRVPAANRRARNYYLIVEAVTPDGKRLTLPIKSEEDGGTRLVQEWGLRVDQATYNKVAADKRDDGIIENPVVGTKHRGELDPEYAVATTGGAITKW
jgi:Family of unknown function (DUF6384)